MGRRTWIKLYCDKWLRGSIRKETPELRSVWIDLLAMAGDSAFGDIGLIKLAENVGIPDRAIAGILEIQEDKWIEIKKRLVKTGRINVGKNNIIAIVKWSHYQNEYQRQKVYFVPPRQDIPKLINFYKKIYFELFNEMPLVNYGKTSYLLKKVLTLKKPGEVADMIMGFLKNPTDDEFIGKLSKSLPTFLSNAVFSYMVNKFEFNEVDYEADIKQKERGGDRE